MCLESDPEILLFLFVLLIWLSNRSSSTPFAIFMYEGIAYFFLKAGGFVDIKQCKLPI